MIYEIALDSMTSHEGKCKYLELTVNICDYKKGGVAVFINTKNVRNSKNNILNTIYFYKNCQL